MAPSKRKKSKKILSEEIMPSHTSVTACVFCSSSENDEEGLTVGRLLGSKFKAMKKKGLYAHYYCMLFSSGLQQFGADNNGLMGFMPKDVHREVLRGSRFRCHECKKKGATIGCGVKSCRKVFHFKCSLIAKSLHQFYGRFETFCYQHIPKNMYHAKPKSKDKKQCSICADDVDYSEPIETLVLPCCGNVFHKMCIQRQAMSSGYYFRCALCNNKEQFKEYVLDRGVYIPEQDAAWEREQGAFEDLYERYSRCDAVECLCPDGRDFDVDLTEWEVILCEDCGSEGCHAECGKINLRRPKWKCPACVKVIENLNAKKQAAEDALKPPNLRKRKVLTPAQPKRKPGPKSSKMKKQPAKVSALKEQQLVELNDSDSDIDIVIISPNSNTSNSGAGCSTALPLTAHLQPTCSTSAPSSGKTDKQRKIEKRPTSSQNTLLKYYKFEKDIEQAENSTGASTKQGRKRSKVPKENKGNLLDYFNYVPQSESSFYKLTIG